VQYGNSQQAMIACCNQDVAISLMRESIRSLSLSTCVIIYGAMKNVDSSLDTWAKFVWKNKASPRVKFFAWLLSQERIQCKINLEKKGIVDDAICETCHGSDESPAHIIFGCTTACSFWNAIGVTTSPDWQIQMLMDIQHPSHIPTRHFETFILLCCWHIWKWRNNRIFRTDHMTLAGTLAACKAEAFLWGARLPKADKEIASSWCQVLANAM
jgi:hypothetical protein